MAVAERPHVRVTLNENKTIKRELMIGDCKVCDLTKAEIIDFIMQATSSLRYD